MLLSSKKTADLNTNDTAKSAQRARAASSAAAASSRDAAQNAALAAQKAASQARAAAQYAAAKAAGAAQRSGGAAQAGASGANKGVSRGVYSARSWVAPRLEGAADYCTTRVAPKVSSALRNTATQVRPVEVRSKKKSSLLTWSLLGAAIAAALGAAAAIVRYRYQTAITADSEPAEDDVPGDGPRGQVTFNPDGSRVVTPPPPPRDSRMDPNGPDAAGDTSVNGNGRVASPRW